MQKFNNVLQSIPGIGPVLAAGVLAEIGDISRFPGQAQLAKYAELTWRKNQSGNFSSDVTPLTKTGNSYLRYYLIQAAQYMVNHNPEYRKYYDRKYTETTRHPHKRAHTSLCVWFMLCYQKTSYIWLLKSVNATSLPVRR